MKRLSMKSISAALMSLALLFTACTDLTDGYSTDPVNITDPTVVSTDKFLAGVEVSLIGIYEADMNRLTGMWSGYFSGEDRQYIGLSNYSVSGRDFNQEWGGIYSSVLKNVQIVKSRSHVEKNTRMLAIAQTIEAMSIGLAADLWGDVPYKEAGQYPTIATPKFDDQLSIYNTVQVLLDSAINNFALPVAAAPAKLANAADFMLGGDVAKWTKVAHTLKARYYLHTRDYVKAVEHATNGIDLDGDGEAANNLMAPHGDTWGQNFNLFYSFDAYDRSGYMGGTGLAAKLLDTESPITRNNDKTFENSRYNFVYLGNGDGTYFINDAYSVDFGTPEGYDGFFGALASFPLVTFEENALILAEANAKLGNNDDALAALNTHRAYLNAGGNWRHTGYATHASGFNGGDDTPGFYMPYDLSDFNPGEIENEDNIDASTALLREILEERYITLVGQLEGFNDIRRTNNFLAIPVKSGNPSIPSRLLYPQAEINTNPNVPSAGVGLFDKTKVNSTPY